MMPLIFDLLPKSSELESFPTKGVADDTIFWGVQKLAFASREDDTIFVETH